MQSGNGEKGEIAVEKIEKIGPKAIPALIELVQNPKNTNWTVGLAAGALSGIGHPVAIPVLTQLMQNPDPIRSCTAAKALGTLSRRILEKNVEGKEAKALQLVGRHFVKYEGPWVVQMAYQAALDGKINQDTAGPYIKKLHTDGLIRELQDYQHYSSHDFLRNCSKAVKELGMIGDPIAVPHLAKFLQRDNEAHLREDSAQALVQIGHKSVVPHLIKALQDNNSIVSEAAKFGLEKFTDDEKILHVIKALQDKNTTNKHVLLALLPDLGRAIQQRNVEGTKLKALQLVIPHFHKEEELSVILKAYEAVLMGKLTKKNARLYIKQLRAVKGKLK